MGRSVTEGQVPRGSSWLKLVLADGAAKSVVEAVGTVPTIFQNEYQSHHDSRTKKYSKSCIDFLISFRVFFQVFSFAEYLE